MKVLLVNGSPNKDGSTNAALLEVAKTLNEEGVETEIVWIGNGQIRDCIACRGCNNIGHCVFDDDIVNTLIDKSKESDGFVFGSPVYYAHANGRLLSILDRLFYAGSNVFKFKPAASVVVARRAGTTNAFDDINKYFGINQMPQISSTYWNLVYGSSKEQILQDKEGVQTMHNIGKNMVWILRCIEAGKSQGVELPKTETGNRTNFIR